MQENITYRIKLKLIKSEFSLRVTLSSDMLCVISDVRQ